MRACVCFVLSSSFFCCMFRWCVHCMFLITLQSAAAAAAALFQLQSIISIHTYTLDTHSLALLTVCVILFFSLLCSDDDTHMLTLTHMMRTITCIGRRHTHTHTHFQRESTQNTTEQAICVCDYRCRFLFLSYFFLVSSLRFVSFLLFCCSHWLRYFFASFLVYGVRICKNIYFCVWAVRDAMTD